MKYLKKLDNDKNNYLKSIYFEIFIRYYSEFDSVGNHRDHIYLLFGVEPKYYPSIVMQIIKIITERKIFKKIL